MVGNDFCFWCIQVRKVLPLDIHPTWVGTEDPSLTLVLVVKDIIRLRRELPPIRCHALIIVPL